jgi:TonB family protein
LCSLAGTVTDPAGAVIPHATITITNLDTRQVRTLTTNEAGQYGENDLPAGRYSASVQVPGFTTFEKTGIVLKAGDSQRADFALQVSNLGCCEYAAVPLNTQQDLTQKKKPFTYVVGDAEDHNSFEGIAKVVYGDPKLWVQIFEANRNVIENSGIIPDGTSILIPPRKRNVPKLISKVMPVYPPSALKAHVWGNVVLDVNLAPDGTVEQVDVIDGPPVLVEAATTAVKQWRYRPLFIKGEPVVKFVVVVSFTKGGKIQ